ncbi:iron chaperone [Jiulongibacter sediminis]|jgi:uncharacterized protein YdhG (YjbR/CyaY superfamily)|uniref:iron chaperone n=1 Tax=Jiulongibacter sediminis TaxID=1605367 RepID=UPI0026EEA268|nr:DUF1801 domain-containing protein [Jiulongibacter sediminis]
MIKSKAKTIDDFLAELNHEQRQFIQSYREKILALVPEATECIHFSTPTFKYAGKAFAGLAPLKDKFSYYPYSSSVISQYKNELSDFKTSPKVIHFSPDQPISDELLQKLIFARIMEIEG